MKRFNWLILALSAVLVGCKDDVASAGAASALGSGEEVKVCATTFSGIVSHSDTLSDFHITQTPDSFLLGECNAQEWGTIHADILAQFACPAGYVFPDNSQVDSVALMFTYSSWFGDGESPLRISVYEMDRGTFDYDETYSSQEDLSLYWSGEDSTHAVIADRTIVAARPSDSIKSSTASTYTPYVRFMMNERFVRKMNSLKSYPSQAEFNQFFKGLYIKTTYGASTALYVNNLTMLVYYHYSYTTESGEAKQQKDTKYLYANTEVRQVNRFFFPNKQDVVSAMQELDSVNFIVSPGYVYTTLTLPMGQYIDTIFSYMQTEKGDTLRPYINKAALRVDVINAGQEEHNYSAWATPASDMLLIRRDSVNGFFAKHRLPSSDYCLLGSLTKETDTDMNYHYYYNFDLSTMLQKELRRGEHSEAVEMVMIPVNVTYTTSSSATIVSGVKINQTITSTIIRSAQHTSHPMGIEVVFSGFNLGYIR